MAHPNNSPRRTRIGTRRTAPPSNRWNRRHGIRVAIVAACCVMALAPSAAAAAKTGFLTERDILTILYNSCGGDEWNDNANWLDESESVCSWYGVSCKKVEIQSDSDDERDSHLWQHPSVVGVELIRNNLQCTLPPEIFYLPHLRTLDLGGNKDLDVDFNDIGKNAGFELKYLRLNDAGLTSLSGVDRAAGIKLDSLDVKGNALTGEFPLEVFNYKRLRNLDLSYNFFSGTLPNDLGNLSRLRTLLLSNNLFSGQIPRSIGGLTKVETMDLSENGLSGTLPTELGGLTRMTILSVRNQKIDDENFAGITGPVFDFSKLRKIDYLDLAGNNLIGTIPSTFLQSADKMSPFLSVDLSKNNLVGTLPNSLSRFSTLRLYLIDNGIEDIAPELCFQADWFFGEVGEFGCNAILCPRGTYNTWGRQISDSFPCESCPGGAPNYGSTHCLPPQVGKAAIVDESVLNQEMREPESLQVLVLEPEETAPPSHTQNTASTHNLDDQRSEPSAKYLPSDGKTFSYNPFAKEEVRNVDIGLRMNPMPAVTNDGATLTYSGVIATLCVHVLLQFL